MILTLQLISKKKSSNKDKINKGKDQKEDNNRKERRSWPSN